MAQIDLAQYGIKDVKEVIYNPTYEQLFKDETDPSLEGFEKGVVTELGAVNVMTGVYTGRSPKDKFIVLDENSKDKVWWTTEEYPNDNKPVTEKTWDAVKELAVNELSGKKLYVVDCFCGANKDTRMAVRFIMEVAWQAHFVTNMFIRPSEIDLIDFKPDFVVFNASKAKVENYKELGLNSETAVVFNTTSKEQVIINTWYGGEMKKGMFSMMNYFLPQKGIASMHCSANTDKEGKNTAIFFGLSGTGKTTLSADPNRKLIGDDEHGWADDSIFNFEGGCYAKCIDLTEEREPEIFRAIKFGSLVENVIMDPETRVPDYSDGSLTENTRVGYPVDYIPNAAIPGVGATPKTVVFLTADAYGVMPPISKLNEKQAMYYFVSGFTSKLAGTERGITSPVPTFSTCFGAPFMPLDPSVYANMLAEKVQKSGANVYLVNTGWCGNSGKRMNLKYTRAMVTAALNGELEKAAFVTDPYFGVQVPTSCPGVPDEQMIPELQWQGDKAAYEAKAKELAKAFVENFKKYTHMSQDVVDAGPKVG